MDVRIRLSHSGERKKPASPWGCVKDRPREHTASAMSQPPARARGHLPACSRPLWGDRVVPSVRYSHLRLVLVLSLHLSVIHEVSHHDNIRRRAASCPHVNSRPPPPAFSFHSDFRAVFLGLGGKRFQTLEVFTQFQGVPSELKLPASLRHYLFLRSSQLT